MFPGSIIAGMLGLEKKEYFEVSEEAMEVPDVDFGTESEGSGG
jgi:LemA protein